MICRVVKLSAFALLLIVTPTCRQVQVTHEGEEVSISVTRGA